MVEPRCIQTTCRFESVVGDMMAESLWIDTPWHTGGMHSGSVPVLVKVLEHVVKYSQLNHFLIFPHVSHCFPIFPIDPHSPSNSSPYPHLLWILRISFSEVLGLIHLISFLELWKRPAFRAVVGPCGSQGPARICKGIQEWVADMHVHCFLDPPIFACRYCKRVHNGQASPLLVLLPRPPWPEPARRARQRRADRGPGNRVLDFAFSNRAVQLGLSESSPNGNACVATQKLQTWGVCVYALFKSHQMQENDVWSRHTFRNPGTRFSGFNTPSCAGHSNIHLIEHDTLARTVGSAPTYVTQDHAWDILDVNVNYCTWLLDIWTSLMIVQLGAPESPLTTVSLCFFPRTCSVSPSHLDVIHAALIFIATGLASSKKWFPSRNALDISWSLMIFHCILSPCPCEPRHATSLHRLLPNTLLSSSLNGTKKTNRCRHQRIMPLDCEPARPCGWERDSGIKCDKRHLDTLRRN